MAPPSYADLGKQAKDLSSKGYHPGLFKFETTTKTSTGVKLCTNGQSQIESGKVVAGSDVTFAWPDYGLKYVEKWNTDNQLTVDVSVEDKILKGLKTSFVSTYNPSSNKKKGTVKAVFKNDYTNTNADVDFDYAGPVVKAATVVGYKGWLAGYQMGFDSSKSKLTANNFSLGYDGGNHVCSAAVNNGQDLSSSYYHRLNKQLEGGLTLGYSTATKATQAALAAKYNVSRDTTIKAKASMDGQVGISLQQKVTDNVSLTLSSILDAKNLSAGGHRVGMFLEFNQ